MLVHIYDTCELAFFNDPKNSGSGSNVLEGYKFLVYNKNDNLSQCLYLSRGPKFFFEVEYRSSTDVTITGVNGTRRHSCETVT